jgi:hypothetical protein
MEVFRRLLLLRLHQAERLSENFMQNLLSWVHPGFSVFAGPPVDAAALASLESQARYITRPALAMDALQKLNDGNLALETRPDPRTGATVVALDPLEWIHRITAHIPIPATIASAFTAPIATGPESSGHQPLATAPVARQTPGRRRTIPTSAGKPGARGRAC